MHPEIMIALANEAQRVRENEHQRAQLRSLAVANCAHGSEDARAARGFAWRLLDGISLRAWLA